MDISDAMQITACRFRCLLGLLALAWVGAAGTTKAADFDEYCRVGDLASALRQTLIIIDEHHIAPEPDKKAAPANQAWRRFVLELTDVRRTGIGRDFMPRERVTLLVARRDGGGLTRLFSGCLPMFSEQEHKDLAEKQGSTGSAVNRFFGWGTEAKMKKDADRAASLMNGSMLEAARPERLLPEAPTRDVLKSGIVSSLARSRVVELSQGLPRIFIFSDLTRFDFPGATGQEESARELGSSLGQKAQIDLERAEVYVVSSGTTGSSEIAREVMSAFFLQSRAKLVTFSGTPTIPNVVGSPVSVALFQGKITFPRGAYPMRLRLAVDRNGTAVNSWLSVQTDIERYTPLGGVQTCSGNGQNATCRFIGDKVLAQIWSRAPRQEPKFEAWMPFSGAREIEFEIKGDAVTGAVFDSAVDFRDVKDNKLRFELSRVSGGAY